MRGGRDRLHVRYLIISFGVLLVVVVASLLLFPEWRQSPAVIILLVVTAAVGVVGFAANFRSAFLRERSDAAPATLDYDAPQHHRNQENVTANVRAAWVDGVLREALPERVRLELKLDSPVSMLQRPMALVEGREIRPVLPGTESMAEVFRNSGRKLLILGAPGSGKTITLLELCEPLLLQAEADVRQPVPVVLNLSTWAQEQKPLAEWIAVEMDRQYGLSRRMTPVWLAHDHLVLLLDGLDEVRRDARDACIRAINVFRENHDAGVVVCSRTADYAELSERLALSRAVEIRPLDKAQTDAYLSDERLGLAAVREAVGRDDALRELSTTPLMLNVMAVAYGGYRYEQLLPLLESEDERWAHLYDAYIERVFMRRPWPADAGYDVAQALRWLRFLAQQLTQRERTQLFIEDLQSDWLPRKRGRWVGISFVVVIGVLSVVLYGVLYDVLYGELFGALFGMFVGVLIAIATGVGDIEPVDEITLESVDRWKLVEIMKGSLLVGVIFSALGGVLVGILGWMEDDVLAGVLLGVLIGLPVGMLSGLLGGVLGWVREVNDGRLRTQPNQGIRRSVVNAARGSVLGGGLLGVLFGVLFGMLGDVPGGVLFGGALGVQLAGLIYGGTAVIKHYILRGLLQLHRLLPLHLVPFLESMRERILVQRAGAHYRFIHRTFQEHIAGLTDERIEALGRVGISAYD